MENSSKPLPPFFIGKEVTEQRKQIFMNTKYPSLCDALGKQDTQSIWYSREHLVKLLEEIDHANGNGIRIYLGTYEQGHEFAGQLCLVMNSTRETNTGGIISHPDVILENEPDFSQRSGLFRDFNSKNPEASRSFNYGSPCPPRCS